MPYLSSLLVCVLCFTSQATLRKRLCSLDGQADSQAQCPALPQEHGPTSLAKRLKASSTPEDGYDAGTYPFNDSLRQGWAKGEYNSRQVQELAGNAQKQGAQGCEKLTNAGGSGHTPGNIHRALVGFFGRPK